MIIKARPKYLEKTQVIFLFIVKKKGKSKKEKKRETEKEGRKERRKRINKRKKRKEGDGKGGHNTNHKHPSTIKKKRRTISGEASRWNKGVTFKSNQSRSAYSQGDIESCGGGGEKKVWEGGGRRKGLSLRRPSKQQFPNKNKSINAKQNYLI